MADHRLLEDICEALSEILSSVAQNGGIRTFGVEGAGSTGNGTQKHILLMFPQVCICNLLIDTVVRIGEDLWMRNSIS